MSQQAFRHCEKGQGRNGRGEEKSLFGSQVPSMVHGLIEWIGRFHRPATAVNGPAAKKGALTGPRLAVAGPPAVSGGLPVAASGIPGEASRAFTRKRTGRLGPSQAKSVALLFVENLGLWAPRVPESQTPLLLTNDVDACDPDPDPDGLDGDWANCYH